MKPKDRILQRYIKKLENIKQFQTYPCKKNSKELIAANFFLGLDWVNNALDVKCHG